MTSQTPSEGDTTTPSPEKTSRKIVAGAVAVVLIVAAVVAVVSLSSSSPTFVANPGAYCAAGKAWTTTAVGLGSTEHVTEARVVRYIRATAKDFGRIAAAAPNQKVSSAFVALQHSYLAEVGDHKALAAAVFFAHHPMRLNTYLDATVRQRLLDSYAAFKDAKRSVAADCSPKSAFYFLVSTSIYGIGQQISEFGDTPDQRMAAIDGLSMWQALKEDTTFTMTAPEIVKELNGGAVRPVTSVKADGPDVRFTFKSGPAVCISLPNPKGPQPPIVSCP